MGTRAKEGEQKSFTIAENLSAPQSFDLSHQVDRKLLKHQIPELPEFLFGDLTDIEYSEASDDEAPERPEFLFGDLTDIEYSGASDDEAEKENADISSRQHSIGLDQPGSNTQEKASPVGKAIVERHKASSVEFGGIQEERRGRYRGRKRRGRKKNGRRAERNSARARKRIWQKIDIGFREGPSQKKFRKATCVASDVAAEDLPRSSTGWQGLAGLPEAAQGFAHAGKHPTLSQLVDEYGMQLVEWNGIEPKVIYGVNGDAIVILVGRPDRKEYMKSCEVVHKMLLAGRQKYYPGCHEHRRGHFPNPGGGFGLGGGSQDPNPVDFKSDIREAWWYETFESSPMQDIVQFTRISMNAICGSDLRDSDAVLDEICRRDSEGRLRRLKGSAFAAATFNLGEQAWTTPHRDLMNLACWFCSVTALGDYDFTKEGHLVLWELRMVVQFPPVGKRTSVVQYSAAGLYRYARGGYKTQTAMNQEELREYLNMQKNGIMEGLKFFRKVALRVSNSFASVS